MIIEALYTTMAASVAQSKHSPQKRSESHQKWTESQFDKHFPPDNLSMCPVCLAEALHGVLIVHASTPYVGLIACMNMVRRRTHHPDAPSKAQLALRDRGLRNLALRSIVFCHIGPGDDDDVYDQGGRRTKRM